MLVTLMFQANSPDAHMSALLIMPERFVYGLAAGNIVVFCIKKWTSSKNIMEKLNLRKFTIFFNGLTVLKA